MSRTTGNVEIDNEILTRLVGKSFRSTVEIDYWDGTQWVLEDSISGEDGISWDDNVKRRKYANYALQPAANTISFVIENRDGRFSSGSGQPEADRYQIDTKIRLRHIYKLQSKYLTDENGSFILDENSKKIIIQDQYTMYNTVFYLDEPSYNVNGTSTDTLSIDGRDAYKYAIEKQVILPDLTLSTTYIDDLIKIICDEIGILYTSTSIADLSAFGARTLSTGLNEPTTADEIFSTLMAIINQSGGPGYQMYLSYDDASNDNVLFVQPLPTLYVADFVFSENTIMQIASFKKDRSRLLQRMTCVDESQVPNERETLATQTYTTDGQKTISLSKDSLYKVYTVTVNSGSPTIVLDQVNKDSLVFTISNSGSVTINVYGPAFTTFPTKSGESINHSNMINNTGQTAQIDSLLFESDDECRRVSEGFIGRFGSPDKEANGLEYPFCNTFLINNDMVFPFIRNIFETDLYYIVGIKHSWSLYDEATTFDIQDSGLNWEDIYSGFIYDSDYYNIPKQGSIQNYPSTNLPLIYDIGLTYDMRFGPNLRKSQVPTTGYYQDISFS